MFKQFVLDSASGQCGLKIRYRIFSIASGKMLFTGLSTEDAQYMRGVMDKGKYFMRGYRV